MDPRHDLATTDHAQRYMIAPLGRSQTQRLLWLLAALLLVLAALPAAVQAADPPGRTFTLQPTGRATIGFLAFCTEFGDKYPDQLQLPNGDLAVPEVRAALQYIADNGLAGDSAKALQGQFAIWNLLKQPGPAGDALTQQVIGFARANTVSNPQGTSILDAARAGQVRLSLQSWEPASPAVQITSTAKDNFYGRGRLVVENLSQQPLTLYMPVGTLFHPTVQSHQTMAAYLNEVTVNNPNLPHTSGEGVLLLAALTLGGALGMVRLARVKRGRRIAI